MKRHLFSMVPGLLFAFRVLGCFPYTWKNNNGHMEVKRSTFFTLWSLALMTIMTALSALSIVYSPRDIEGMTARVSTYLLSYGTYSVLSVFFPYIVLRSYRLAESLRRLAGNGASVWRPVVTRRDYFLLIYIAGTSCALTYLTYNAIVDLFVYVDLDFVIYDASSATCDFVSEVMVVVVVLLVYYLLKIIHIESKNVVDAMCENFGVDSSPLEAATEEGGSRELEVEHSNHMPSHSTPATSDGFAFPRRKRLLSTRINNRIKTAQQKSLTPSSGEPTRRASDTSPSHNQVANYLMSLDEVVLEITDYAGPLVIMILLTSTVNATTMLYLTSKGLNLYYCAYISLKILCVVEITRLADPLWWKVINVFINKSNPKVLNKTRFPVVICFSTGCVNVYTCLP
ncbi:uncharacterized protein [Macrobrachium rosenbergii]|uniref:uncharacterized protein n=1 Tax=Macrobrachium rosenbergii TaxID=79674 RepID=UPI0034D480FD